MPFYTEPTFYLSFFYLAVTFTSLAHVIYYISQKHRLLSFHFAVLFTCIAWGLTRTVTFMFFNFWSYHFAVVLDYFFWFPVNIQFLMFSFLSMFYLSVLHKEAWNTKRKYILTAFLLSNLALLIVMIVTLSIPSTGLGVTENARTITIAVICGALVLFLGVTGVRVRKVLINNRFHDPKLRGFTPIKHSIATGVLVVIFFTRFVYCIVSTVRPEASVYFNGDDIYEELIACFFYLVWEIIPCFIVLGLFWASGLMPHHPMRHHIPEMSLQNSGEISEDEGLFHAKYTYDKIYTDALQDPSAIRSIVSSPRAMQSKTVQEKEGVSLFPNSVTTHSTHNSFF